MKIGFDHGDREGIIGFIYERNNHPDEYCHLCPKEYEQIQKEIGRLMDRSTPSVLVLRGDAGEIQGVFRVLAEPEERYLELLWGFVCDRAVYAALFDHLRREYAGFHLDAVVNKVNAVMYDEYEKQGVLWGDEELMMLLEEYTPKAVCADIVKYAPEYEASFRAIHKDEGVYWTAERMLQALENYNVLLAVENGEAVGYIEMTKGYEENEPIQILVKEECRGKGLGRALLQRAIEENMPAKTMLEVYVNNTPALNLYLSLGFREVLREFTGSMTV